MTANELRIGNWLQNNGEQYQITGATIISMERGDSFAEPIPITDEWLHRFGFEIIDGLYRMDMYWGEFRDFTTLKNQFLFGCFNFEKRIYFTRNVESVTYVHQLQNLYYALTGQELEVKSP